LREIDPKIVLGVGVIDIKVNHVETPDEWPPASNALRKSSGPSGEVGASRLWFLDVETFCGRPEIEALVKGRNKI